MTQEAYQPGATNYGIPVVGVVPMAETFDWCFLSQELERQSRRREFPVHRWQRGGYAWQHNARYLLGRDVKNLPGRKARSRKPKPRKVPLTWGDRWALVRWTLLGKFYQWRRLRRYVRRTARPSDSHWLR